MDKKSEKKERNKEAADRALRLKFYNLVLQQPAQPNPDPAPLIQARSVTDPSLAQSPALKMDKQLLPTSAQGFTTSAYWNAFFEKQTEGFEWYGQYNDLAQLLHKYILTKDDILIVGCGNSDLSSCLHWDGYKNQISIDISPVVIAQMQMQHPYLQYKQEDVTSLTFPDESFTCVFDKGTYDALAPPPTAEEKESIKAVTSPDEIKSKTTEIPSIKMLEEVKRVLKPRGRFVCISLLQPHLALSLFSFFHTEGWMIRVCRCPDAEEKNAKNSEGHNFPVYMCVFTKMTLPGAAPIEFADSTDINAKMDRLPDVASLMNKVKEALQDAFIRKAIKKIGFCAELGMSLNLFTRNKELRYTTHTVDIPKLIKNPPDKQFGIFIVPQGRESEYMFGTHEGRTQLAIQSGFTRLVVVHMVRGQKYGSMDEVQAEISSNVAFVTPSTAEGVRSPIMTDANNLGVRKVVFTGESKFSGKYVVEDVASGDVYYRRLIFVNSPHVIQSEVLLGSDPKRAKGKGKMNGHGDSLAHLVPLYTKMTCEHHEVMAYAFGMIRNFFKIEDSSVQTLLIGLGGGLLVSFLRHFIPSMTITAVEIDEEIVKVAREYFVLPKYGPEERLRVVVDDGLEFLKTNDSQYNVLLIDVDNKSVSEGLSCPPRAFVEPEALESMKARLTPEGILVLNLVCRNPTIRKEVIQGITTHFPFIYQYAMAEDVNVLLFCFMRAPTGGTKSLMASLTKSVTYITTIQQPKVPLSSSKKVKNGSGGGDGLDDIDKLGMEAIIQDKSRNFKLLDANKNK